MAPRVRRGLNLAALAGLLISVASGCGGEAVQDVADGKSGADPAAATATIDPASMPEAATIVADIDGTIATFSESDAGAEFQCELSEDRVEITYESATATLRAEYLDGARVGGDEGVFNGTATIVLARFDRGGGERYSSAGAEDVQVVIDPPYAMITARFTYRESSTDTTSDDVGTATIAAHCGDGSQAAGSGTEATSGSGTADSDGHAASITVDGETYDFGALAGEVTCAAAAGIYRGSARTEAQGGGTLGFESVVYAEDASAASTLDDPPYVRLIDDGADVDYVAGPIPGDASIDPGSSRVVEVTLDGTDMTASLEMLDRNTGSIVPGVLVASCPR